MLNCAVLHWEDQLRQGPAGQGIPRWETLYTALGKVSILRKSLNKCIKGHIDITIRIQQRTAPPPGMYIAANASTDNFVAVMRGGTEEETPGTALVSPSCD